MAISSHQKPIVYVVDIRSGQLAYLKAGNLKSPDLLFSPSGNLLLALDKEKNVTVFQGRQDQKGEFRFGDIQLALHTSADRKGDEKEGWKPEQNPLPKDARKLTARVKTVSKDNLDQDFTQHLQKLSVSITKNQIVLDFDVDRKNWLPVTRGFSLVARVFDKDGKYLTHFVTKESFTASPDVFDGWMMVVNRVKDDPPQVQAALLGGFTPKLLEANGNRLIYNVNPALLQNAAIVEIGFIHVPKKAPF